MQCSKAVFYDVVLADVFTGVHVIQRGYDERRAVWITVLGSRGKAAVVELCGLQTFTICGLIPFLNLTYMLLILRVTQKNCVGYIIKADSEAASLLQAATIYIVLASQTLSGKAGGRRCEQSTE